MPLPKLLLPPDAEGYNFKNGTQAVGIQLEGGAMRIRKDLLGAASQVPVKWSVKPANYDYLMAFYRRATNYGADPFLIDLPFDKSTYEEQTVKIVPGTWGLDSVQGLTFVVSATLELIGNPPTGSADDATIAAGPQ